MNAKLASRDINTSSNYQSAQTQHTAIDLKINFERRVVLGSATLSVQVLAEEGIEQLLQDTNYLMIINASMSGKAVQWKLEPLAEPNGRPLCILLDRRYFKSEVFDVKTEFETVPESTGLQWFSPSQTDDKRHPFMFSQCEPVHARTIYPCQDTPSIKSTFDISIHSCLPVVASGVPETEFIFPPVPDSPTLKVYTFKQTIPISNYLFAIASGNLVSEKIGPKSYIYCAPGDLDATRSERQPDLQAIITSAENLIFEYPWPLYNLVILPKSFHLGGMENPIFNFYSATVISGDRENVSVVAHEFAHSYSGNLVTNASWEHFWLNEGWTVYIERFIMRELRGEDERTFQSIVGWNELLYGIQSYGGDESPSTSLVLQFNGKRPDDIMSKIAYEKGYTFLRYLENLVGEEKWLKFVPHYFETFRLKAVDSAQFKQCVLNFFASDQAANLALDGVDWEMWLYKPGPPPRTLFQSKLYNQCITLADRWSDLPRDGSFKPSLEDVRGWTVGQQLVFLDQLINLTSPIPEQYVTKLESLYNLATSKNLEVLSRYLRVALRSGYREALVQTREVLGITGRMKFVRPLFECLIDIDRDLALSTFNELKSFYHPTCVRLLQAVMEDKGMITPNDVNIL